MSFSDGFPRYKWRVFQWEFTNSEAIKYIIPNAYNERHTEKCYYLMMKYYIILMQGKYGNYAIHVYVN